MQDQPERVSGWTTLAAFAVVVVMIGIGSALLLASRPAPVEIVIQPPQPTITPAPTATPGPIVVYVTGAVAQTQQSLSLPAGSRVQAALDAAGGTLPEADLERVNVAAILRDGDQVHVPFVAGAAVSDIQTATPPGGPVVRLNTATSADLETLPGIGPALAARIIAYRDANGPFSTPDDLLNISGIGPVTLDNIRALIVVD